jgi:hypothetical protein
VDAPFRSTRALLRCNLSLLIANKLENETGPFHLSLSLPSLLGPIYLLSDEQVGLQLFLTTGINLFAECRKHSAKP